MVMLNMSDMLAPEMTIGGLGLAAMEAVDASVAARDGVGPRPSRPPPT